MATIPASEFCHFRYALLISYIGTRYNGFQRQTKRADEIPATGDTVQEAVEWALQDCFQPNRCKVTSASRTDRGVHARMNLLTLPLMRHEMPTQVLKNRLARRLLRANHEIIVRDVILAPSNFHPRLAVTDREYLYRIVVPKVEPQLPKVSFKKRHKLMLDLLPTPMLYRVTPVPSLNVDKAREIMDLFTGEHNFGAFVKPAKIERNTVKDLRIELNESTSCINDSDSSNPFQVYDFVFRSHSFLHNQIRRIVGAVITYASYDKVELSKVKQMLDNPNETTPLWQLMLAEPWGLTLNSLSIDKSALKGSKKTFLNGTDEEIEDFLPIPGENY